MNWAIMKWAIMKTIPTMTSRRTVEWFGDKGFSSLTEGAEEAREDPDNGESEDGEGLTRRTAAAARRKPARHERTNTARIETIPTWRVGGQ